MFRPPTPGCFVLGCLLLTAAAPAQAVQSQPDSALHRLQFEHPTLRLHDPFLRATAPSMTPTDHADLERLGVLANRAFLDSAGSTWGTLILSRPLVPGSGVGNRIGWADLGFASPATSAELAAAAETALFDYLERHALTLRIEPVELERPLAVTVHRGGELIQVSGRRTVQGLPVRGSRITASISHGNLVLLGVRNWAPVGVNVEPSLSAEAAVERLRRHLGDWEVVDLSSPAELIVVPVRRLAAGTPNDIDGPGEGRAGLRHRLAWRLHARIAGSIGRWRALVDAHDGTVLGFSDANRYASTRKVSGGVFPVTNDGEIPDGVEQPGWPMPFADVATDSGTLTTDSSGHLPVEVTGTISTALTGPFAAIVEECGTIFEESDDDIDLGAGPGTNCEVPPGASPGNTHSARTTFYELNRVKEVARGQLPANLWLQQQLTAITNYPFSCSANWNGEVIQLGGDAFGCAAAGEVAGVVDHEWAHGMDQNDANGFITSPAEGIADVYSALRLNTSCIGRGLLPFTCTGYGDPCIDCDGVRDIDWAKRASGQPHDIAWALASCTTTATGAPCGRLDHCESVVVSESIWDLYRRTLPAAPFGFDSNTSLEIATRLTYLGAGAVDNWYTCDGGGGSGDGCNADGGYLNYLAADDDNGDLGDGTPHMQAIFDAFDAHGIACATPTVQNSGCQGAPNVAPTVTATPLDRAVSLSWDPVPGAQSYQIFRAEGVFECDFSKVRIGETTDTTFVDSEVRNDFEVYYTVSAIGPADTCLGPMSACTHATPTASSGLEITAGGSCPGTVRVRVSGATPSSPVNLYHARQSGSFTLPGGPCAGTEVDLSQPRSVGRRRADAEGNARFSFELQGSCGGLVQALGVSGCSTSPAAMTP